MSTRVGIVGGGFGGLYTALYLRRFLSEKHIEITLFDSKERFVFTPLLHEVFSGNLPFKLVSIPFKTLSRRYNFTYINETVTSIHPNTNTIQGSSSYSYDYIVIATGSKTFPPPSDHPHLYTVSSPCLSEAIKNKENLSSLVVVGAGATGVEIACEISYLLYEKMKHDPSKTSLHLLSSTEEILPTFSPFIQTKASDVLSKRFIHLHTSTRALSIKKKGVKTSSGYIPADCVIWVAGTKPLSIPPLKKGSQTKTTPFLTLPNSSSVFVIGDTACIPDTDTCVPALAQSALAEAHYLARALYMKIQGKTPPPFSYRHKATLLSLGPGIAVGEFFGMRWYGAFTWWIWRTVYLFRIPLLSKKIAIAWKWTLYLFRAKKIRK